MPPKILIIGIHDAVGGIEQVTRDYVSRIRANNKDIEFAFTNPHEKIVYQDEYEAMGCKIRPVPNVKKHPFRYARTLTKIIKNEKYDAVHYNMLSAANIVPLIAARLAGCRRIIAHAHNTGTVGAHKRLLHHINRTLIPLLATDLLTCSDKAARFMFGRRRAGRAVMLRNAINTKKFAFNPDARKKTRAELGIEDSAAVFGHVGRFAEQKNHRLLIEIFRRIAEKHQTAVLLLIGEGHLQPAIRRLTEKYGLAGRTIFHGTSGKVHELYSAMDAFILPSLFEGLGMAGIEAQCNGLPVTAAAGTIPAQMDITGSVKWRSLKDPPEKWAETALESLKTRKTENLAAIIAAAGYDIDIEAGKLEEFYKGNL